MGTGSALSESRRAGRVAHGRPCREETVEEGGEIEAGLRIILRDADLEPRVCADPMLIGMAQNLGRPRRQWSSRHLIYRAIYILTQLAAPGVRRGINPPARPGDYRRGHQRYRRQISRGRQRRIPENSAARLPERNFQDMLENRLPG